jgi:superfamily I DNA and/or RNA helicase
MENAARRHSRHTDETHDYSLGNATKLQHKYLNPVVNLDPLVSERLRQNYEVSERYDYGSNSIYKTFLASDSVSDEILLSHHYRCDARIIEFSNRKYYNGKLKFKKKEHEAGSLSYYNVSLAPADTRNTAPAEVAAIVDYVKEHPKESIGSITPFTNQRDLIQQALRESGVSHAIPCGTVHAFQGDEQDTILFSTGLAANTSTRSYAWLAENKELINVATTRASEKLVYPPFLYRQVRFCHL